MPSHPPKPNQPLSAPQPEPRDRAARPLETQRRRRQKLVSLAYTLGLLLVFIVSLLLLPADTGLGKVLRGAPGAGPIVSQ
ncbi:hypothetical protein [Stutzerimonas stutzeri]|uniref:Uncharacterized protein n=1 Tax=Stutzerimonas stutzeri TaxID=316 RepID=A0A6I6LDK0_STUST|nr:hypothetical protein [Stutzerimonas stutzeri]QGZ28959.1 hypothetical protein GQA94_02325 [Stutzerimonas stutzeri]